MGQAKTVLFVCVENSNRSQMAEAFARIHGGDTVEAFSSGSRPSGRVNPKAVVMAFGAMVVYVRPDHLVADVLTVTLVFGAVNVPSVGTWAAFGHVLRNALDEPGKLKLFNIIMALLLVASIVPMVTTG